MQEIEQLINQLRVKVHNYFDNDQTGHKTDHLERTLKYAMYIQEREGGDKVVVAVSAFIHDVHRILAVEKGHFVTPKESLPIVEDFIKDLDITNEQKKHILYAVEHHEDYNFGSKNNTVTDIESKIVQDADNLDAIGAHGIIRALEYDFFHKTVDMYDPNVPLYQNEYEEGYKDASTIHHLNNKILRLGENMNTATAREISKPRTKLVQDFVDMYLKEFYGEIE